MKPESLPQRLSRRLYAPHNPPESTSKLRPAAVLLPLLKDQDHWSLLYTRRTDLVDSHRGQVAFPGGVIDASDEGPVSAALRETQEEIGVQPDDIEVLGLMEPMPTITQFCVTPVVGVIPWPYQLTINPYEVAATFVAPLDWLSDPNNVEIRYRDSGLEVDFFKPYQNEIIWGATARITLNFLSILEQI